MNLRGKTLLILGANPETAGLVRKANEMGVRTIVTDYDPKAYAKRYAHVAADIDAVDLDALYELALREQADGVLVGVAEALLPTYQKLCKRLGFPYYAELEILELMSNKKLFKEVCRKYDVPVVEEFGAVEGDFRSLEHVRLPVVVKPVDSCSSKGISVCHTQEELESGVEKALSYSNNKQLLIEKYMTGEEVVVYYAFQNGEPVMTAMCDRYTNKEQEGVAQLPTSYIFPSRHMEKYIAQTDEKVKHMFKSIGIQHGTTFIQSFIDDEGGVRFYEPGYRLNGAQEHYIVNAMTGIDVKELMIHFALTGKMSDEDFTQKANPRFTRWGCRLSPLLKLGKIGKIEGLEEIAQMPEVVSVNPSYDAGDTVTGLGTLKQIACIFFVVADTKGELKKALDKIHQTFKVEDENGNSMFLQFFDTGIIEQNY